MNLLNLRQNIQAKICDCRCQNLSEKFHLNRVRIRTICAIGWKDIVTAIDEVENNLKSFITETKIAKEAIDVTLPRQNHLKKRNTSPINIASPTHRRYFCFNGLCDWRRLEKSKLIITIWCFEHSWRSSCTRIARHFYTTTGLALRFADFDCTNSGNGTSRRSASHHCLRKVFRRDTPDMTHVPMFHQIEGLCVDKGNYDGTFERNCRRMVTPISFGKDTKISMWPSYFFHSLSQVQNSIFPVSNAKEQELWRASVADLGKGLDRTRRCCGNGSPKRALEKLRSWLKFTQVLLSASDSKECVP